MVLNIALKSIWQVPLKEGVGTHTWAFPSGHTQTAIIFWGWLAWEVKKKWFYPIAIVLFTGCGYSTIHFGYHDPIDVYGAFVFAFLLMFCYHFALKIPFIKRKNSFIGFYLSLIALLLIYFLPRSFPHTWLCVGGLIGCSLGWTLNQQNIVKPIKEKQLGFAVLLLGIIILTFCFTYLNWDLRWKSLIQYAFISFWLTSGFYYLPVFRKN